MGFRDMVEKDNLRTFLDLSTFGEKRSVVFDGERYAGDDGQGIPCLRHCRVAMRACRGFLGRI